ncbi:MAG: glycosyltransferase, partial [Bacteroidota bacterium]
GDFGGRELETGFIAKTLQQDQCEVSVISTTNCSLNSQIFEFIEPYQFKVLDEILLKKNLLFKVLAQLSYLKSGEKKPLSHYVSNTFSKKLGYKNYAVKTLRGIVEEFDVILICAQISSAYVKGIVEYAYGINKQVVIRTSSKISEKDRLHKDWLEKVTLFIHHSESNASRLSFLENYSYQVIDQCTYREEPMLRMDVVNSFKNILFVGRFSPEKGIKELVTYFKIHGEGLNLTIVGDGPLYSEVEALITTESNINLLGYKSQDEVLEYIKASDAIIIPSFKESGPLAGLEAMASGRLIISTKVGAMPHRLKNTLNQFWFDINDANSLKDVFMKLKGLTKQDIKNITQKNREIYLANYRKNTLENLYKNSIFSLLKAKPRD